jgi:hypothetical protein
MEQTGFQIFLTSVFSSIANSGEAGRKWIQENTKVRITRDVYDGVEITDTWPTYNYEGTETYYKDNLSVKVFGIELNNIEVQSVADHPLGGDTMESGREAQAQIGESGATKPYIQDTLLFDDTGNFLHRVWQEGRKPGSQGCVVTQNADDEREVMNILRNSLLFNNEQTVQYEIQ